MSQYIIHPSGQFRGIGFTSGPSYYVPALGDVAPQYDAKQTIKETTQYTYGGNPISVVPAPGDIASQYDAKQTVKQTTLFTYGGIAGPGSTGQHGAPASYNMYKGSTTSRNDLSAWNWLPGAGRMNINLDADNAFKNLMTGRDEFCPFTATRPSGFDRQQTSQNYQNYYNVTTNPNKLIASDNDLYRRLDARVLSPLRSNPFVNPMLQSII